MSSNQIISKCYIVKFLYFISSNYIKSIVLQLSIDLYLLKRFIVFLPSHLTYLFLAPSIIFFSSLRQSLFLPFFFLGALSPRDLSPFLFFFFFLVFFLPDLFLPPVFPLFLLVFLFSKKLNN